MKTKNKSFKRLFAFLVALVMVTALVPSVIFAADPTFTDVKTTDWFYKNVENLAAKDVVSGYKGTKEFKPNNAVTRQEAAKMIALGAKTPEATKTEFTDLLGNWADPYIMALEADGVVSGFNGTKEFKPLENIKRGHVAKMIALAFGLAEGSKAYTLTDIKGVDNEEYIKILASNGIVSGFKGTTEFKPNELVTRAQMAKMIDEAMQLELEIISVRAINAKTVEATFNKKLSALALKDFSVYEKDDEGAINVIAKLAKKDAVATLTLTNALEEDTDYILDVDGVGQAEFTYEEAEAASIAFVATTVAKDDVVEYVIKDADGNDITANFGSADLTVQTSDESVVDGNLKALKVGFSVVNIKINDTEIETGNKVIEVKSTLQVLTSIGKWSLNNGSLAKPKAELYLSDKNVKFIASEVLDQDGKAYVPAVSLTYESKTPTVLVVDKNTGELTPQKAGTATVVLTATDTVAKKTVTKTVQITVKADPVATSLVVEPKAVTLVTGSSLTEDVTVKVLDQHGDKFPITSGMENAFVKADFASVSGKYADDVYVATLTPVAKGDTTLKFTFTSGTKVLTETITVKVVEPGNMVGYKVEVEDLTLDLMQSDDEEREDLAKGPVSTEVRVFQVDASGNKISELKTGFSLAFIGTETKKAVDFADAEVTAEAVGTQKLNVLVGTTVVDTLTFTVVDSTRALDKVVQLKNALTVDANATATLFSADTDNDEAFVGYDQYGDKFIVASGVYTITSSDSSVVDNSGKALKAGTAKLTIVFGELDLIFTIDIVVPEAV